MHFIPMHFLICFSRLSSGTENIKASVMYFVYSVYNKTVLTNIWLIYFLLIGHQIKFSMQYKIKELKKVI